MASITLKKFSFNDFQENTYLVFNDKGNAIIIDPGCYYSHEQDALALFLEENQLTMVDHILTHSHIDHLLGSAFIEKKYGLSPRVHQNDLDTLLNVKTYADVYGFKQYIEPKSPHVSLVEGEHVVLDGEEIFEIKYVPGHAPGHVVFVNHKDAFVINGDCLFYGSIGRTDLPGGNHQQLLDSIKRELFSLPDHYKVYCGHGPETSIGFEKENNPFLN